MPTITTDVDFEAFCDKCKSGICSSFTYRQSYYRAPHQFTVEPCDKCLENAREEGYEEARKEFECNLEHV